MKKIFLSIVLLCLTFSVAAHAQPSAQALEYSSDVMAILTEGFSYPKINEALSRMEKSLEKDDVSQSDTVEYIKVLGEIQSYILQLKDQDTRELGTVQTHINALGPVPETGVREPVDIAKKRREFTAELNALRAKMAESDLILSKIDELNADILKIRNERLINNIMVRQSAMINPKEFYTSVKSFGLFLWDILKSPITWHDSLTPTEKETVHNHMAYAAATILIALVFAAVLSYLIRRRFGYRDNIEKPDYGQKVTAAIALFIAYGVVPASIFGAFLIWVVHNPIMNVGSFGLFLKYFAIYALYIFLSQATVKVIFAAHNPKWRLIEVDDEKAKSMCHVLLVAIITIAVFSFFQIMAKATEYNEQGVYAIKALANFVKAICLIWVVRTFLYNDKSLTDEELTKEDEEVQELSFSSKISILLSLFIGGAFVLTLFGYIKLSEFLLNRFITSVLIIGLFYMINKLLKVIFDRILNFKYWTRTLHIKRKTLNKASFWFGFIVNPITLAFMGLFLLAVWGVSVDILINSVRKFLTGFDIGGIRISISSIFLGIVSFFGSLLIFRLIKNSLNTGALSKIEMDPGVRSSLSAGVGFLGVVVSIVFGIAVMGGSLKGLAIIAGALSFGIGLGMQNIVSNFVSGIILIFERPIKIGDWVNVSDQEGIVKQINIRATEIETFNKTSVIIPNSDILSKTLINMTHHNKMSRMEIAVGVAYDSDLNKVKETLLDIAQSHPKVLKSPAPYLVFSSLNESSLDFELRCYTSDINARLGISNDLKESIINRFREEKIDIPFPQRVVYLQPAEQEAPAKEKSAKKKTKKTA